MYQSSRDKHLHASWNGLDKGLSGQEASGHPWGGEGYVEVGSQGGLQAISRGTIYSRGENLIHPVNVMDEHNIMLITVKVQAVFKGVCSSAVNREHASSPFALGAADPF